MDEWTDADAWGVAGWDPFAPEYGPDTSTRSDGGRTRRADRRSADVPAGDGSTAASGWRGVDPRIDGAISNEQQIKAAQIRAEPHVQILEQQDAVMRLFTHAQFVGYLTHEMKMLRNGGMAITFQVPFEFKHLVFGLADAVGVPLSIDVQVWKPYTEANDAG